MVTLTTQQDFRRVRNLSFCYLCGLDFKDGDTTNRDHVPPQSAIAQQDREPLLLKTHTACNGAYHLEDEKIGQLIALRYAQVPRSERQRLRFVLSPHANIGAVTNVNIDRAVWRWVAGFHAALYQTAPVGIRGSLVTPFARAQSVGGRLLIDPLRPQHQHFVNTIKQNRARQNLDRIRCNKGKVIYECLWAQADHGGPWLCIFALDIYDWKDLGRTPMLPARGCAGFYTLPSKDVPANATKDTASSIIIPAVDLLDPFGH